MKKSIHSNWLELEYGVHLNTWWLNFGLNILSSNENYYHNATDSFFKVNHKTTLYVHKTLKKMSQLDTLPPEHEAHANNFYSSFSIFMVLHNFSRRNGLVLLEQSPKDKEFYLESKEKHEVFIPFLTRHGDNTSRFYLSTSLNNPIDCDTFKRKFDGFERFVTAGCLFGASLQAIDKKGATFPIIQHKIAFVEGEQIININPPDKALHPYEIGQFNDLKGSLQLMENMSKKGVRAEILYHLPNFDYILSAIKLYIHNKMTYEALQDFYAAIKERSKMHTSVIRDIFKGSSLALSLESPFINLLKDFFANDEKDYNITYMNSFDQFNKIIAEENTIYVSIKNGYIIYKILSPLGNLEEGSTDIAYQGVDIAKEASPEIAEKILNFISEKGHARGINAFLACLEIPIQATKFINHKRLEEQVTQKILALLCTNSFHPRYASVWRDIIRVNFGRDKVRCIESLFKAANAVMIAVTAKGLADHNVCSFLPFNENPIFRKYKAYKEQFASLDISYPEVFSLTRLESLIFYSNISEGNVFYFQRSANSLGNILNHETFMKYNEQRDHIFEQAVI